jgi:hypothetical protein
MVTRMNTASVLRLRGCVCRCLAHACQRARVRGADGMAALRACEYGSLSSQPWTDTHRWVGIGKQCIHTPCLVRLSSYARVAEADMRHVHAQGEHAASTRARSCACVGAPASAPTRASTSRFCRASRSRRAGFPEGVGLQREHRRVEHRLRHDVVLGMRRSRPGRAPRRTALGRSLTHAQPLCAAAPPMSVRARVRACACSYVYKGVCGWIADGHTRVLECHRAPSTSRLIDVQRSHA